LRRLPLKTRTSIDFDRHSAGDRTDPGSARSPQEVLNVSTLSDTTLGADVCSVRYTQFRSVCRKEVRSSQCRIRVVMQRSVIFQIAVRLSSLCCLRSGELHPIFLPLTAAHCKTESTIFATVNLEKTVLGAAMDLFRSSFPSSLRIAYRRRRFSMVYAKPFDRHWTRLNNIRKQIGNGRVR
jgi:hypothetical protein